VEFAWGYYEIKST